MKKKLILLFLFLCFALVGCNNQAFSLRKNFDYTYDDSFTQDTTNLSDYFEDFYIVADDLFDSLAKDGVDEQVFLTLEEGTVYQRDDLPLINPNYYTQEVQMGAVYSYFSSMLMDVRASVYNNSLSDSSVFDYGFNETGGFHVNGVYNSNNELTSYFSDKFLINDDSVSFERLHFDLALEQMTYTLYNDSELYVYSYHDSGNYSFRYINTETYDCFSLLAAGLVNSVAYYDHSEQLLYEQNNQYNSITKYNDFTPVAKLTYGDLEFNLRVYFSSMSGWDSLAWFSDYETDGDNQVIYELPSVELYNDGLEVYSNYDVQMTAFRIASYSSVYLDIEVDNFETQEMPYGFTGDVSFSTLSEIILELNDVNYLYEMINLEKLEIRDYCQDLYINFHEEITE